MSSSSGIENAIETSANNFKRQSTFPNPANDPERRDAKAEIRRNGQTGTGREGEDDIIIEEKRKRMNGDGYTFHKYLRGRLLGKGGFAKVYLCTALDTNRQYAVKVVPKANLVKTRARQKLQAEIKIHRTLKHDNICEYKHFFEDRKNCYILLELCHNQSLNELIKRRKRLTEPETALFLNQLIDAVEYMHKNCVIHRDLKLGNLFLDRKNNVKVGDLGLATRLLSVEEKRKTICGTPNYIAPEIITGSKETRGHSFEVDIWSIGVILYTVLVGKPPYEAKDVKATYKRIISNEYRFPSHVKVSDFAKDLIVSMLQSVPTERPSLQEIREHPFSKMQVPKSLPMSILHHKPEWIYDDLGNFQVLGSNNAEQSSGCAPSSSRSNRLPFSMKDPNVLPRNENKLSNEDKVTNDKDDKINVARKRKEVQNSVRERIKSVLASPATTQQFEIFDENAGANVKTQKSLEQPAAIEEIVVKATKMTLAEPDCQAVSDGVQKADDNSALERMLENLTVVLDIAENRKNSYDTNNVINDLTGEGSKIWVTRYVDYTSKYGLGFLLSDGSSGVYFNDSTKAVLEAHSNTFQYILRKKIDTNGVKTSEPLCETYSLTKYPEVLQKKVTLLKHFRNYLIEQQNKSEDADEIATSKIVKPNKKNNNIELTYLKKWVRTKHAILFRLSNDTVQIVFYDQTEILLTSDSQYATYVDKSRGRKTYFLTDETVGTHTEMAKRLRYSKEILNQLLNGQQKR
eukprot:CAMPEP_0194168334 /NCGR_PEP_ID=MMETSP0154-20130528/3341_1 /TAXON_ID=1049557 /ORGANISM="Thalassiothrix antarctica, Strain L6-D1" /LENGTH=743 /DNA_ID=CAMNT_0038879457 /DNA_START=236 /DNA_END=2467 /DNA_ORIENTATION=-